MAINSIAAAAAATLPVVGIVLALANWQARPDAAWAWAAAIVMFVIMLGARRRWPVAGSVVFGALLMIVPLAVTLAHAYSLIDDPDSGRRASMIILGAYLVITGNALPRMAPRISSMPGDAARLQAFHRLAGWTWVLGGLGYVLVWLVLPTDVANLTSTAIVAATIFITVVQLLRLRNPRPHAPGVN